LVGELLAQFTIAKMAAAINPAPVPFASYSRSQSKHTICKWVRIMWEFTIPWKTNLC